MPDLRVEVRPAPRPPLAERDFELCEHKGVGHPDSIADGACEAAAVALAGAHLAHVRRVGHFNVDKGLLIAGRSRVRFGGGEIIEPMRLIVCGRATSRGAMPVPSSRMQRTTISRAVCAPGWRTS